MLGLRPIAKHNHHLRSMREVFSELFFVVWISLAPTHVGLYL